MRSVICTFDLAGGPIPPLHDRHVVRLRSFFALAVGWRGLDTARSTVFGPVLSLSFSHQAQAIGTSDTCTTSSFVCVCVFDPFPSSGWRRPRRLGCRSLFVWVPSHLLLLVVVSSMSEQFHHSGPCFVDHGWLS